MANEHRDFWHILLISRGYGKDKTWVFIHLAGAWLPVSIFKSLSITFQLQKMFIWEMNESATYLWTYQVN